MFKLITAKNRPYRFEGGVGAEFTNSSTRENYEIWRYVSASNLPDFSEQVITASYEISEEVTSKLIANGIDPGNPPSRIYSVVIVPEFRTFEDYMSGSNSYYSEAALVSGISTAESYLRAAARLLKDSTNAGRDKYWEFMSENWSREDPSIEYSLESVLKNNVNRENYEELFDAFSVTEEQFGEIHRQHIRKESIRWNRR